MGFRFFKYKKYLFMFKNPYKNNKQNPQHFLLSRRRIHQFDILTRIIIKFFTIALIHIISAKNRFHQIICQIDIRIFNLTVYSFRIICNNVWNLCPKSFFVLCIKLINSWSGKSIIDTSKSCNCSDNVARILRPAGMYRISSSSEKYPPSHLRSDFSPPVSFSNRSIMLQWMVLHPS